MLSELGHACVCACACLCTVCMLSPTGGLEITAGGGTGHWQADVMEVELAPWLQFPHDAPYVPGPSQQRLRKEVGLVCFYTRWTWEFKLRSLTSNRRCVSQSVATTPLGALGGFMRLTAAIQPSPRAGCLFWVISRDCGLEGPVMLMETFLLK